MEEDVMMPETGSENGEKEEHSGVLELDGDAWKERGSRTYTSVLDRYGVADLFSEENMERYREIAEEERREDDALTEYLFSGQMSKEENGDAELVEQVFSQKLQISRVKERDRGQEDNSIYFVLAELLFVLVFLYILMKVNAARKKRREQHAVKVDMESERETGYGPVGI